jgi:hypothetical protein
MQNLCSFQTRGTNNYGYDLQEYQRMQVCKLLSDERDGKMSTLNFRRRDCCLFQCNIRHFFCECLRANPEEAEPTGPMEMRTEFLFNNLKP